MGIEAYGYEIRYWTGDAAVQSGVLLACLAAVAVLARQVFAKAFGSLLQKRCTSELLAVVSAVVMAADCVARLVLPERSAVPCYAPVGCLALVFAMWGGARESRGLWDLSLIHISSHRDAEQAAEGDQLVDLRQGGVCLPFVDGLAGDTQLAPQSLLGQPQLLPLLRDALPNGHIPRLLSPSD